MADHTNHVFLSPQLATLSAQIQSANTQALDIFWDNLQLHGTPLIEPLADPTDHYLVTFLWRADEPLENIVLISDLVANIHWSTSFASSALARFDSTSLYYRTFSLRGDARFTYQLSVNQRLPDPSDSARYSASWQPDPLNHNSVGNRSLVELPNAPCSPWLIPNEAIPAGTIHHHRIKSTILGNDYRAWVYTPPDYISAQHYPLLLLFDGSSYLRDISVATILDNLIAAEQIPPLIAVLLDSPERNRDLALYAPFLEFLRNELELWVQTHYPVTSNPARRIVGGQSLGGLSAFYAGLVHPELFGNVLSQSGGVFWAPHDDPQPGWLARQFATRPLLPLRLYFEVGLMEREPTWNNGPSQLEAHRELHEVVRAKGYWHQYHEYNGDHHVSSWRHTFANGLQVLIGGK